MQHSPCSTARAAQPLQHSPCGVASAAEPLQHSPCSRQRPRLGARHGAASVNLEWVIVLSIFKTRLSSRRYLLKDVVKQLPTLDCRWRVQAAGPGPRPRSYTPLPASPPASLPCVPHSLCSTAPLAQPLPHSPCSLAPAGYHLQHSPCSLASAPEPLQHSSCTIAIVAQPLLHSPCSRALAA